MREKKNQYHNVEAEGGCRVSHTCSTEVLADLAVGNHRDIRKSLFTALIYRGSPARHVRSSMILQLATITGIT